MSFQETLSNYLLQTFPDARLASGGSEVVMRCRFCGDSQKDIHARHLYIKVNGDTPVYNCFKCNSRGILTPDVLRTFKPQYDSSDTQMMELLKQHNSESSKTLKSMKLKNKNFNIMNEYISMTHTSELKLKYINHRLGLNLTYRDLIDDKIVLNLRDLLRSNYITEYTRDDSVLDIFDRFGIGFLSLDNGFVTLKNLADPGTVPQYLDNKYNVYSIFKDVDGYRSYIIPSTVFYCSPEPVKVHIAEGPFDILSIFHNLRGSNRNQNVYVAICGKAYFNTVQMCIINYAFMNAEFHLYVDNDVSNNDFELMKTRNYLRQIHCKLFIHRNIYKNEKDMGVSIDKIKESVIEI